jgi:hypothetical protein
VKMAAGARRFTFAAWLCCALGVFAQSADQKTFRTPEDAVLALVEAAKAGDTQELLSLFGTGGQRVLFSGDPVMDQRNLELFLVAYTEHAALTKAGPGRRILNVGNEGWPFPIPLVKERAAWRFDTAAGAEEILYRRVGRDELSTIRVCQVYVEAQHEYAAQGHDGKPAGIYAQKIVSTPGRHDGLYWKSEDPEALSPLGEFAAEAASEGYGHTEGQPTPYNGYFFRILTAQGESAMGGARNYVVNGEMRDGFALIAHPSAYRVSGVMSFIVNQDGLVYQKDLGPNSAELAAKITRFEPNSGWQKVK